MYVPDPAEVLRRQATVLRAGSLVVPIEFDIPAARALPATPLVNQALAWVAEAFTKGGIQPALGTRLWAILREAGLRPLGMLGIQPHFGSDDPGAIEGGLPGVIRTAAPLIERTGMATAEEIGIKTFAQRLRDDLRMNQAVFAYPWCSPRGNHRRGDNAVTGEPVGLLCSIFPDRHSPAPAPGQRAPSAPPTACGVLAGPAAAVNAMGRARRAA